MSTLWTFDLVSDLGNPLTMGGLVNARQRSLTYQVGAPASCQFLLPLTSPEAEAVCQASTQPYVKAYRTDTTGVRQLRFYGPVWVDEIVGQGGADAVMVTACDASIYLTKRFNDDVFTATDCGSILKQVVDTTNTDDGDTGILTDAANITASSSIDLDNAQNTPSIASLQSQFATQLDACESWVEPIELVSGKFAELYAAPMQGGSETTLVFGYGQGSSVNCSAMGRSRNKEHMENDTNGFSDALTAQATNSDSISAFRRLKGYTSYTNETDQSVLTSRTQGRLRERYAPDRISEYKATPTTRAPKLFDDYNLGDIVTIDFRKGITFNERQRIVLVKIDVSDAGLESYGQLEFRSRMTA